MPIDSGRIDYLASFVRSSSSRTTTMLLVAHSSNTASFFCFGSIILQLYNACKPSEMTIPRATFMTQALLLLVRNHVWSAATVFRSTEEYRKGDHPSSTMDEDNLRSMI